MKSVRLWLSFTCLLLTFTGCGGVGYKGIDDANSFEKPNSEVQAKQEETDDVRDIDEEPISDIVSEVSRESIIEHPEHENSSEDKDKASSQYSISADTDSNNSVVEKGVEFHVVDDKGNTVKNVSIVWDYWENKQGTGNVGRTDEDGTCIWENGHVGKFAIVLNGRPYVQEDKEYEVSIDKIPAKISFVWPYSNPDTTSISEDNVSYIKLTDKNGKPIANVEIALTEYRPVGEEFIERAIELGVTDKNGIAKYQFPTIGKHDLFIKLNSENSKQFLLEVKTENSTTYEFNIE